MGAVGASASRTRGRQHDATPLPGSGPPPFRFTPALEDLVRWASAADDYTAFHYDDAAARAQGFPGPIVHGTYQAALASKMLLDWLGADAAIDEMACRYRQPAIVGERLEWSATVTSVDQEHSTVHFDIAISSQEGVPVTTGTAVVRVGGPDAAKTRDQPGLRL